jgi:hypothetical protein
VGLVTESNDFVDDEEGVVQGQDVWSGDICTVVEIGDWLKEVIAVS